MSLDGDSSVICHSNTKNLLKNNEICCLKPEILSDINLECSLDENKGTIPLVFSSKHNGFNIIRADTGFKVSEFEASNVSYIKWFLPAKYLEDFENCSPDQEFGIVTVDSQNVLKFYPRFFEPIKLKNNVIGLFTSYFRCKKTDTLKLAVLVVECDGTITRWVPFESNSTLSRNVLKKQVKLISDTNVLLELNNLKVSIRGDKGNNDDIDLGVLGTTEYMDKCLELNGKLFLVTYDPEIYIIDPVTLGIIRIISFESQVNLVCPFIDLDLNEKLVTFGMSLRILDLNSLETVYEYSNTSQDALTNFLRLDISNILNVKVDLLNPNLLIISSDRIYLLDILRNNLVNFVNISTNKLYLYYYICNTTSNNNNGDSNSSSTNKTSTTTTSNNSSNDKIKFGCIGLENYNLVAFDLFKLKLLYNKISIYNNINFIANSQLQPNLLLTSSNNSLIQFDIHYTHTSNYNTHNHFNNRDSNSSSTDKTSTTTQNNNIHEENKSKEKENEEEDREDKRNMTISRVLSNNLIGIKKYKTIIRSEITCITFHPRLPNVSSVGCRDGSLFLFFLEFENVDLFEFIYVHKFNNPIKGLVWHLVPGGLSEKPNLNKKNFLQRVWKSIYSSKYTSVLLIQLDELDTNIGVNSTSNMNVINTTNTSNRDSNSSSTNKTSTTNLNSNNKNKINGIKVDDTSKNNTDDINSIYFMKLVDKPKVYRMITNEDEESGISKCKLFSIFIIQYPPQIDISSIENNDFTDFTDQTDSKDSTDYTFTLNQNNNLIKYNNFSLISDHICMVYHTKNWVLLRLFWMDWNFNIHLVKRFRVRVKGDITNILLTHKQYNQYLLYNNTDDLDDDSNYSSYSEDIYRENEENKSKESNENSNKGNLNSVKKVDNECKMNGTTTPTNKTSNTGSNSSSTNKTSTTTTSNNTNHIHNDPDYKSLTCTNPLQQYLIISTNLGYIYTTTLVRMYNNLFLTTNSLSGTSGYLSISEELLLVDELFISKNIISDLKYTILHSFHSPLPKKSTDGCLCTDTCHFILAVGLPNLILIYRLIFDHYSNKFKLLLLHFKKCNYNNFILISEPYNYFKLLINSNTSLSSHSFTLSS